eukprot:8577712-Lingulodinium_polyedra.AAC.1
MRPLTLKLRRWSSRSARSGATPQEMETSGPEWPGSSVIMPTRLIRAPGSPRTRRWTWPRPPGIPTKP